MTAALVGFAILLALTFLGLPLGFTTIAVGAVGFAILRDGSSAFRQTYATIPVTVEASVVDPKGNRDPAEMAKVLTMTYGKLLEQSLADFAVFLVLLFRHLVQTPQSRDGVSGVAPVQFGCGPVG